MKNFFLISGTLIILSGLGVISFTENSFLKNSKAKALLTKGKLLLEQDTSESMKNAVEIFSTVASHFPDTEQAREALFYLAESYEKLGNVDVAIGKYRKLLALNLSGELFDKVRFKIAKLQLTRYNTEEGLNGLLLLLSEVTDDKLRSDIYKEIARYYTSKKENEQALKNYEISLTEFAKNDESILEIASLLVEMQKYEDGLAQFKKYYNIYLDREGTNQQILHKYKENLFKSASMAFSNNNLDSAAHYYQFLSDQFAGSDEGEIALYNLGNVFYKQKHYDKAIGCFDKVVKSQPELKDENGYIKLGQSYFMTREFEKAASAFSRAVNLYPDGKYILIARQWEEEAKKELQEKYSMENLDDRPLQREKSKPYMPESEIDEPMLENGAISP